MHTNAVKFLIFIFILFGIAGVKSQNTVSQTFSVKDTSLNGILYYNNNKTDYLIQNTFEVQYDFFMVHYYNNARIADSHYWLQLNNEGSAVKDMIFHIDDIFNYKRQTNTYLPYIYTPQNVKYFQNRKAYTSVSYSNSIGGNQFFKVNFAKNLYKGLNLQTEYFVNYADETFSNSQVMNQFFNVTLNYISPSGRYRNNLAFAHNRAYIQENGGIENDSVFINQDYSKAGSYPVTLSQGWSKWKTSDYSFFQTYRLETDNNKSQNIFNKGAIIHNISFGRYARLYDDENKTIKDSLGTNIWRNSLFWTNNITNTHGGAFIPLTIGVNYDAVNFNDSLDSKTYHLVSPEFKTGVYYSNLRIDANASAVVAGEDYNGDYQISIEPKYYFNKRQQSDEQTLKNFIFSEIKIQNKQPDYIFKHYLTENLSWDNYVTKNKTKALSLGVNFANHLTVKANYIDLKDFYFLDDALQVNLGDSKLYQLQIHHNIALKKWRFLGTWTLQKADNEDVLHLPLIAIKQGIAYSFTWMKGKLKTDLGTDINYFSKYKADVYNTLTGMYCFQNEEKIGNYLFADVYLNLNIDRFCLFVMLQHPYAGLAGNSYFNSPLYPAQGFTFRYGFTWKLLD
ncbi:MAG: hypothetical protein J6P44_04490 [Bacteroidales bacterium]|nr:hypothetical protein [Bacteroidales bacterium]